jgi:serine/threonine protein kinase
MAPDTIRDASVGSFETDLWSLGITMIVVLTGAHPYPQRDALLPLMSAIIHGPQPELDHTNFPQDLCNFVAACLNQPKGDGNSCNELLNHPLMLAAKERGVVSDDARAKLSTPCQLWYGGYKEPEALCQKVIENAVQWQLDEWGRRVGLDEYFWVYPEEDNYPEFDKFNPQLQEWLAEQAGTSPEYVHERCT